MALRPSLKHSLSSPNFELPHRRLHRRHTENALHWSGSASSEAWLNQAESMWSLPTVQNGKANIDATTLKLKTSPLNRRKKKQKESLEKTVEHLENLPTDQSSKHQSQLRHLVSLISPHADSEQIRRLESLVSEESSSLYRAIEQKDLPIILASPLHIWTRNMLTWLELSFSSLCMLACKWASCQYPDRCLREDDALVWLLHGKIPQLTEPPEDGDAFIKQCCRVWRHIPKETMHFLSNVQLSLPLKEIDFIPTLLHFAFFRIWSPKHPNPKLIKQLLQDKRHQNRIHKAGRFLITK